MHRTLLALGDEKDLLFRKYFAKNIGILKNAGYVIKAFSYMEVLENPQVLNDPGSGDVTVLFFFPVDYWDTKIEIGHEIYGSRKMGGKFEAFFNKVESVIRSACKSKVTFVNDPASIALVRDKKRSHEALVANNVACASSYGIETARELIKLVDKGTDLILKVRYGSLGKGVSLISRNKWYTNFKMRNGSILNHSNDKGWKMKEISKRLSFIGQLLEQDVHIEKEIKTPIINNQKLDLRVFVIFGEPVLTYVRTAKINNIITNWHQGGRIEPLSFLNNLPEKAIEMAEEVAVNAANAYGLNYAGIDVIFSENYEKVFVLEGNAFPGSPSPEIPPTVFDPMRTLFEMILQHD
ncbi:MAG: hypothetical protein E3J72_02160 [Planctomycetota bacterium]|nr:MAG: hypothetical protein E3J72_02160 [Planctomycetota bacterium]